MTWQKGAGPESNGKFKRRHMQVLWAVTFLFFCCAGVVDADPALIPRIKAELAKLYKERDELLFKAQGNHGVLSLEDRERFVIILHHIEALKELLEILETEEINSWQKQPEVLPAVGV